MLHGEETSVWADKGYVSAEREAAFTAPGKAWGVMRKAPKGNPLHPLDERANRIIAMVRAKVENPFRVIKRQFDHVKTRYRGLAKNRAAAPRSSIAVRSVLVSATATIAEPPCLSDSDSEIRAFGNPLRVSHQGRWYQFWVKINIQGVTS